MAVDPNKYSIYAARDADKSNVNWGKVAKDLNTTLTTVAADKITKRAALDTATQEAIENLSQVADVKNSDAQSLLLNGAEMSKENLLLQSDMMKKGLITTKDYMLFLQQQKSGYANLSSAIKNWDKYFQESELRLTPDSAGKQGSAQEIWSGKTMAAFGNLQDKILWTNPNTGQMQLVQMGKDENGNYTVMPDPNKNPEKFMNPNSMNSRMNIRIDKKDLNTEVQKIVKPLGKTIQETLYSTGTSIRKEGFRFADISSGVADDKETLGVDESKLSYEQWIESQINKLAGGSNDQVQILTDNGYTIAASKDEFYRNCQHGRCTDEYWIKGDTTGGELVWNHIVPQADLEAKRAELIIERDKLEDDTSEKNILIQQIAEIDRYLKDNKLNDGKNVLVNGLSDSQIEKAKQIAQSTIDTHIDNIEKTTYEQEDKLTGQGKKVRALQTQDLRDYITILSANSSDDESALALTNIITRANDNKKANDPTVYRATLSDDEIIIERRDKEGNLLSTTPIPRNITDQGGLLVARKNIDEIIGLSNRLGRPLSKDEIDEIVQTNQDISIEYDKRTGDLSSKTSEIKIEPKAIGTNDFETSKINFDDNPTKWIEDGIGWIDHTLPTHKRVKKGVEMIQEQFEIFLPEYLKYGYDGKVLPKNLWRDQGFSGDLKISSTVNPEATTKVAKEELIKEGNAAPSKEEVTAKVKELKENYQGGSIILEIGGVTKEIILTKNTTTQDIKNATNAFIKEAFNALNARRFGTSYYTYKEEESDTPEGKCIDGFINVGGIATDQAC